MKLKYIAILALVLPSLVFGNGETASPNMGFPIPAVGVTTGPQWASDVNQSLLVIDSHDHSSGNGVQVSPSGLNINSDLTFQSNNATNLRSSRFFPFPTTGDFDATASDLGALYEIGVDLYYVDGSGNIIRITQSGSVSGSAGTITGLPSGTASASYSSGSGTFVFQQATSTAANIDAATYVLRYPGSYPSLAGNYIALQAPASLATAYSFTLPATSPATSGSLLTASTAGLISYSLVDNSTLQLSGSTLLVKSGGITATQIANATITGAKIAAATITGSNIAAATVTGSNIAAATITGSNIANGTVTRANQVVAVGQQLSSSGSETITDTSYNDVTNLTVTITTTGRPVILAAMGNSSAVSSIRLSSNGVDQAFFWQILRDSTVVAGDAYHNTSATNPVYLPCSSISALDPVGAGTYTYKVQAKVSNAAASMVFSGVIFYAYEL